MKTYRSLVRIMAKSDKELTVCVPAWNPTVDVPMPLSLLPIEIPNDVGSFFIAQVNIGADDKSELVFSEFENIKGLTIDCALANPISPDHWLNEPRFEWFKKGYEYAATQTQAISAMSQIQNIGSLYHLVTAIMRANKIEIPQED